MPERLSEKVMEGTGWERHDGKGIRRRARRAYGITSTELLLRSDDSSTALSSVESALALDRGLACCAASTGLASNFRDSIPVVHDLLLLLPSRLNFRCDSGFVNDFRKMRFADCGYLLSCW
jgi:hypothetical protein